MLKYVSNATWCIIYNRECIRYIINIFFHLRVCNNIFLNFIMVMRVEYNLQCVLSINALYAKLLIKVKHGKHVVL